MLSNVFNPIKEINWSRKGMSNIYLKVNIEAPNFNFLDLKNLSQGQFLGAPTHADITEFKKTLVAT